MSSYDINNQSRSRKRPRREASNASSPDARVAGERFSSLEGGWASGRATGRGRAAGRDRTASRDRTAGREGLLHAEKRVSSRERVDDRGRADGWDRDRRRDARSPRTARRSVGADSLALSSSRALGLVGREATRAYGRGETARRIEEDHEDAVVARPAVFTEEPRERTRARIHAPHVSVRFVAIAVAVVAMGVVVFGSARTYYSAWRDAGILQVRYEVVAAQNESLNDELESLQTLEGIEDEARRRGYVYPDEEAVVANGVEEEAIADPAEIDKAVAAYEESQPWYVRVLDAVFGYSYSAG